MSRRALSAAFAMLVCVWPAAAQQVDCADAEAQQDLNLCAAQDYERADAELNAIWPRALAAARDMDAEQDDALQGAEQALRAAQRGWIAYRDGQCVLAGFAARGGSMEQMLVSGCLAALTRVRTRELVEITEGDEP